VRATRGARKLNKSVSIRRDEYKERELGYEMSKMSRSSNFENPKNARKWFRNLHFLPFACIMTNTQIHINIASHNSSKFLYLCHYCVIFQGILQFIHALFLRIIYSQSICTQHLNHFCQPLVYYHKTIL
jgi:hypothetical protein